jgi:hypothetical protein
VDGILPQCIESSHLTRTRLSLSLYLSLRTPPRVPLNTGVSSFRSFFLGEIRSGLKISPQHAVFFVSDIVGIGPHRLIGW